jgi:hypothetical protein
MKVLLVYEIDAFRRDAARANPPPRLKGSRHRDTCIVRHAGRVRAFRAWIARSTIDEGPPRSHFRLPPRPADDEIHLVTLAGRTAKRPAQSVTAVSAPYGAT